MKQDIKSMTLAELQDAFAALGEPKFRAKQVFAWLHRGAVSFEAMTNLSKPLRETLDSLYFINRPTVARKQISRLDGTIKYLWRLRDGQLRRIRRHAVPPRQHRLHLLRGRLPDGLQVLRVDHRRPCPAAGAVGAS